MELWYSFAKSKAFLLDDPNKDIWVDDPEPFVAESNDLTNEKNVDCVIYEYQDWTISIDDIKSPEDIEYLTNLQKLTDFINGR